MLIERLQRILICSEYSRYTTPHTHTTSSSLSFLLSLVSSRQAESRDHSPAGLQRPRDGYSCPLEAALRCENGSGLLLSLTLHTHSLSLSRILALPWLILLPPISACWYGVQPQINSWICLTCFGVREIFFFLSEVNPENIYEDICDLSFKLYSGSSS